MLSIPREHVVSATVGFGHPTFDVTAARGEKERAPLSGRVDDGRFGEPL